MNAAFATWDRAVVAALEEKAQQVLDEIQRLQQALTVNGAQGDPDYKTEITYLTKHYNAYNKALFYWEKGVRPERASNGDWLIPSGSQGGAVIHRIARSGGVWVCGPSCKANAFHWHGALLEAFERAEELAALHDDAACYEPDTAIDPEPFLPAAWARAQAQAAIDELFV